MNEPVMETSKSLLFVKEIWEEVLGVDNVSKKDRFLDLGGNSLNVVEVISRIRDFSGVSISPKVFFDKTTNSLIQVSQRVDEAASPLIK